MAKTNFTKAEQAFDDERRKQMKEDLLREADLASGKAREVNAAIEDRKKVAAERKILVQGLLHDLKVVEDRVFEENAKIDKASVKKLLQKGLDLTDADYEVLKRVKKEVDLFKGGQGASNEKLVEEGRKKHINKRFNVRDKWLPLK